MRNSGCVRLLAYVTGSANQELLSRNEYLAAENRILRRCGYAFPTRAVWKDADPNVPILVDAKSEYAKLK